MEPGVDASGIWWTNPRSFLPDEAGWRTWAPYRNFDPIVVNTSDVFSFDFRYNMNRDDKIIRVGLNVAVMVGADPNPNFLLLPELPPRRRIVIDGDAENEERWGAEAAQTGSDAKIIHSPTAPQNPAPNQLWFDTVGGQTYVWYENPEHKKRRWHDGKEWREEGVSAQWVAASNLPGDMLKQREPEPQPEPGPIFPAPIVSRTVVSFRLFPRIQPIEYEIQCMVDVLPCGRHEEWQRQIIALAGLKVVSSNPWIYG